VTENHSACNLIDLLAQGKNNGVIEGLRDVVSRSDYFRFSRKCEDPRVHKINYTNTLA
jgi:hypothetical protein